MKKDYLIPRDVVTKTEIIGGMGIAEVLAIVAGGVIGYVLQLIPAALPIAIAPQLFARALLFALPMGLAYALVRQGFAGGSLLQMLGYYRRWASRPKIYVYRRGY